MRRGCRRVNERLPAQPALVSTYTRMLANVALQTTATAKRIVAMTASEVCSRMSSLMMFGQVSAEEKRFVACTAFVRTMVRVLDFVRFEISAAHKRAQTKFTLVWSATKNKM